MNRNWDGQFPGIEAALQELVDAAGTNSEIRIPAVSLLSELLTAQGRLETGMRLDREAWLDARNASMALPLAYEDLLTRHCLNLIRAGELDELGMVLDDYAAGQPARLMYSGGMLHLMRGYSRLRQGRMRESYSELLLGVDELTIADPLNLLPFAHAVAAYAAAAVGHQHEAHEHALAYRLSVYREPRTLPLLAEAYARAADAQAGLERGGGVALADLADEAERQGLRGVETDIRRLALRSGDTGSAASLASSSSVVEGAEARLLEAYGRAVSASDATDLIGISDDALGAGHLLLALEAAQQAERCLEENPDRWRLTGVQRRVHHRLVEAGMSPRLEIVRSEHGTQLTARETEILELVSHQATNAEIAKGLSLSPRTVEGYLSRIFAKLGVSRRAELLEWGTP